MLMRIVPVVLIALLAACSVPAERPAGDPATSIGSAAECERQGGEWMPMGRARIEQCLLPTADAGRACSDSAQCQGQCLAPEGSTDGARVGGTCSVDTNRFGCQQRVSDGVALTICVD